MSYEDFLANWTEVGICDRAVDVTSLNLEVPPGGRDEVITGSCLVRLVSTGVRNSRPHSHFQFPGRVVEFRQAPPISPRDLHTARGLPGDGAVTPAVMDLNSRDPEEIRGAARLGRGQDPDSGVVYHCDIVYFRMFCVLIGVCHYELPEEP